MTIQTETLCKYISAWIVGVVFTVITANGMYLYGNSSVMVLHLDMFMPFIFPAMLFYFESIKKNDNSASNQKIEKISPKVEKKTTETIPLWKKILVIISDFPETMIPQNKVVEKTQQSLHLSKSQTIRNLAHLQKQGFIIMINFGVEEPRITMTAKGLEVIKKMR
jgi:hypothetical protein